ncbi:hypothetical protein JIX56_47385 [Streptomyces sp. CA-210063]|uniref:hypothetical protein n=1 Tax=Streptomyces sp. CA-210063 TaxID=2801029 RepID=UPI00214CDD9C|nr:hypothetical protein [Streptomyces sp. CA-210063]UUU36814.1 hypothetical protein JIX56_47385 [Streptomyces sp. CA-210063]
MGGTQVSANQIDLHGAATISIPVPGEARPRSFTATADLCTGGAWWLYICAYSRPNLEGAQIAMTDCGVKTFIPWSTVGSWDNNQTPGTRARFYYVDGSSALRGAAPATKMTGENWANVRHIKAC